MRRTWLTVLLWCLPFTAWAHPGRTDACHGHTVREHVAYGKGDLTHKVPPSEVGEYHFHMTPDQANQVMTWTQLKHVGDTFTIDGAEYEIMPPTRDGDVLLRCQNPDGSQPVGIVRVVK